MKILMIKAVRDLWTAKLRTISIILAIMISVGLGIGLVNATKNVFESFDKRTEITNYEDMDIHFETAGLNLSEIEKIEGVRKATGRLFFPTQVEIAGEKFKANWISAQYYNKKPYAEINGYQLFSGKYVSGPDTHEVMIGNTFAKEQNVEIGDAVTIFYGNVTIELTISGIVASPEYIYVVDDSGWPQPSLLVPLFSTYEMAISELGIENGHYNELLVITEDGVKAEDVKHSVENRLTEDGIRITKSELGTEEADYQFSRVDAEAMGQMGGAFGVIILGVTAVVIYNSLTRLVASQRTYIGVMGALGGKSGRIIFHYCLFGFFMGAVGSILGVIFGITLSKLTVIEYAKIIGLLEPDKTIYWIYPVLFSLIGIGISTLAAFFGSLKVMKIGPREALTSLYYTQVFSKKSALEKVFDGMNKKRSILTRIPLRNLSRHKFRTSFTIFALALSMILVFSCLALSMSFTQPLENNYENYEKWDLKAHLFEGLEESEVNGILDTYETEGLSAEPSMDNFITIKDNENLGFVHIQAFSEKTKLRHFNVIDGKKDFNRGILVGSILASELDLEPGSIVTFVIGNMTTTAEVTGITGELVDDSFIMTLDQARDLLLTENIVNALIINQGTLSRDNVENVIRQEFQVASFNYTDDVINGMETMLSGLISMFMIFILFGIVAEVLFISTTVVLNILDREMEFISLRAMGAGPGKIKIMIVNETLILLFLALIIGLPLSFYITQWAMWYIAGDIMYYELGIAPSIYILTALFALISALSASLISGRHITKLKLADAIRQRIIS